MPVLEPVAPRQMLPPPTTTAISVPRSWRTSAISLAMRWTTAPSIVSSLAELAKASPESFSTTRCHGGDVPTSGLTPYLDLGEADDRRLAHHLANRALVVPGVGLLDQHTAGD